jgi:hypothetical protein
MKGDAVMSGDIIVGGHTVLAGKYPIFISVEVGYENSDSLFAAVANSGANVSVESKQLVNKDKFIDKKKTINVAKIYPDKDFGLSGWVSKEKVRAVGHANGLVDLNGESGLAIESKYTNQPYNELVYICMKPVEVNGRLRVLFLDRHSDGGRWVGACDFVGSGCGAASPWLFGLS